MKTFRLVAFLAVFGFAAIWFSSCRFLGLGSSEVGPIVSETTTDGTANVTVQALIPTTTASGVKTSRIASSILASTGSSPTVTFRLVLLQPGDSTPVRVLSKTVEAVDGSVQISFSGIPAATCLGEMVIEGGSLGGKTDFHGALDLSMGDNVLQVVPKGCGDRCDILAAALREIWNSPELLKTSLLRVVSLLESSGARLLSGIPAVDTPQKVYDSFVAANLPQADYTRLELDSLNSTLSASGKNTWTKTVAQVATTPSGASQKTCLFSRIVRQGFGTFAFVAWQADDGTRFGISKLDLASGETTASLVIEGECGPTALLPGGGLMVGGTLGGYPLVVSWNGSGNNWVNSTNFSSFSAGWAHRFLLGSGTGDGSLVRFLDFTQVGNGLIYSLLLDSSSGLLESFRMDPADGTATGVSTPQRVGIWAVAGVGCATIGWDNLPGTWSYSIFWSDSPGLTTGSFTGIIQNAGSPHLHAGLTPDLTYRYLVVPYDQSGAAATPSKVVGVVPLASTTMKLFSSDFSQGGSIPEYCAGSTGNSPNLFWTGVPADAKSLAITCSDLDATGGSFTHWLIYDIPTSTSQLKGGVATLESLSDGMRQGINDFGEIGYAGPNPPVGTTHNYLFTIFALDTGLNGETGLASQTLSNRISGHILASATLKGSYYKSGSVTVTFSGNVVDVDNPYSGNGIEVTTSGAEVTVNSILAGDEVKYNLKGTTTDGSFKIYSSSDFTLNLNGVAITNPDGPALNIQSAKRCQLVLSPGTTNTFADGTPYGASTEDQKGTLFSEGNLQFRGTGSLTVTGHSGHAICGDGAITFSEGSMTVVSAVKDGIHAQDLISMSGGTLDITATSDSIESEKGNIEIAAGTLTATNNAPDSAGLKAEGTVGVTGGAVHLNVGGNQSKGIKAKGHINLGGGTITIGTSGAAALKASGQGYDPEYCTGVKGDANVTISGSTIEMTCSGAGGKGISAKQELIVTGGTINVATTGDGATYTNASGVADAYSASCLTSDGNMTILAGSLNLSSSGKGGKGISTNGTLSFGNGSNSPTVVVTTTGQRILISGTEGFTTATYSEPKAIKSGGAMTVSNGNFTIETSQAGAQGLDSDGTLTIAGGILGITVRGAGTKAIKSTQGMFLSGGTVNVTAEGNVVLENVGASTFNPSYCTAIKSASSVTVNGAEVTISNSGTGGKGISGDGGFSMTSGSVTIGCSGSGTTFTNTGNAVDSYNATCITSDGTISILGGTVSASASNTGGKCLSSNAGITIGDGTNSPTLNLTTSGTKFLVSGWGEDADYCHPKTMVSNGAITVINGSINISSTDDAIHSETSITQNGGAIDIKASVEGIEAPNVTFNGGTASVVASDDGINPTMGNDVEGSDGSCLYVNGGTIAINVSGGDGIDSNGNVVMTGGTVIVQGPPREPEVAFDVNGTFSISGGYFIACGPNAGRMIEAPSQTSTQCSLMATSNLPASTIFNLQDSSGNSLVTFQPVRNCYYVVFSAPTLANGGSYQVYTGGSSTGTQNNGLFTGGTYSGGTLRKNVTLSGSVTSFSY